MSLRPAESDWPLIDPRPTPDLESTPEKSAGRPAETEPSIDRPQISAIITSYNERDHIEGCIRSVEWCDEIIVVDSYSTDGTPDLAKRHKKVRLFQREYCGGASQKNWAIQRARHEWILILDSDERCTPALREEIESLLASGPEFESYTIARRVFFLNRVIRFSGWRNDRVTRLFKRGSGYYQNRRVHARLVTLGTAPLLRHPMDHYMVDCLEEYNRRLAKYAYWGAAQNWIEHRRTNFSEILVRTAWRFVRTYIAQYGFLDGRRGFLFCGMQAYATYLKWTILWNWQINAAQGIQPALPVMDDEESTWRGLQRIVAHRGKRSDWRPPRTRVTQRTSLEAD